MKRLLLATSILALAAGGALAQGVGGVQSDTPRALAPSSPSTSAPSGSMRSTPAAPAANSSSTGSSMTGSSATGSSSTGSSMSGSAQASSDDVTKAQQLLRQQGLYKGPVDGKIGPETRTAITQFQKRNGLQQTAQLDEQTKDQLEGPIGAGSARAPSNAATPSGIGSSGGTDKDDDNDVK